MDVIGIENRIVGDVHTRMKKQFVVVYVGESRTKLLPVSIAENGIRGEEDTTYSNSQ